MNKWWIIFGLSSLLMACENDERDDTILNMSDLTGKYWFYNQWRGDRDSYEKNDVLEVVKFEKNGELVEVNFGGRNENTVGTWTSVKNEIDLNYTNREAEVWDVLHSGTDYIDAIINGQGERQYLTDAAWLEDLTADAFYVNEYTSGNVCQTHIGGIVRGNLNVREANLITSSDQIIPMENQGYFWKERVPVSDDFVQVDGKSREVRFYIRIGKNGNLKLKDNVYGQNLPERSLADVQLEAKNPQGVGVLTVSWNPYGRSDIYYRVEVFDQNVDMIHPYFISRVQMPGCGQLVIRPNTAGEVNRMSEMKSGGSYVVRLSALMFEPGTDVINDEYGYANLQAVTYVSKPGIFE